MYCVYVLISLKDRKLYVGYSSDLGRRVDEHQHGKVAATKHRLPIKLIYHEINLTEFEAKRRERYLKGGNGRATLKRQIDRTLKQHGYKYA